VVLVSPRNPLNIGAAARAMANFSFSRLTVVAPFAPHWREARSAIGAPDLLQNANETASLAEAVADCTLVIGTGTRTYRRPEQPVISLPCVASPVCREIERGGRVAIIFGPEKHGLTRDDLALCHSMVEIPTDVRQPSMNLGQAVAVCLYELACHGEPSAGARELAEPQLPAIAAPAAVSSRLDLLARMVEQTMEGADYPSRLMDAPGQDLRVLLRRLSLSDSDLKRILGLFRRILWRLNGSSRGGRNPK
jgi:TrmH family RNA methyltransferase